MRILSFHYKPRNFEYGLLEGDWNSIHISSYEADSQRQKNKHFLKSSD